MSKDIDLEIDAGGHVTKCTPMTDKGEKLKACPFCGSNRLNLYEHEAIEHTGITHWFIGCEECGIVRQRKEKQEVIKAWNRRTPAKDADREESTTGPNNCTNPECPYGHYRAEAIHCCCVVCIGMLEDKSTAQEDEGENRYSTLEMYRGLSRDLTTALGNRNKEIASLQAALAEKDEELGRSNASINKLFREKSDMVKRIEELENKLIEEDKLYHNLNTGFNGLLVERREVDTKLKSAKAVVEATRYFVEPRTCISPSGCYTLKDLNAIRAKLEIAQAALLEYDKEKV